MTGATDLSRGFFQTFHEGTVSVGFQPVLQIIEARSLNGPQTSYRVRLSDGVFSYSACGVAMNLRDRFSADKLTEHNAIIRITDFRTNEGAKRSLTIADYEVIDLDSPVLGTPISHNGKPEDYRGILNVQLSNKAVKRAASPDDGRQPLRKRNPSGNVGIMEKTEIALITPYINKWQFKVFNFTVTDQSGRSIRVAGFGETAEKFHPMLSNGQTYYVSGGGPGSVKSANKQFNSTGHDYELMLGRESDVTPCTDVIIDEPKFRVNAVPLLRVTEHINECIDVLAVIDRASELSQVTTRAEQKQLDKRDLFLIDESAAEVSLTLWGDKAKEFNMAHLHEVIGIKGALVKEFNGGVSLSTGSGCVMKYNPEGPATNKLYNWYQKVRQERDLRLIGVAVTHHIGRDSDKGVYFTVKAMITAIKTESAIYQGCPTEGCKKKVIPEGNQYRCEKCQQSFSECKHILMLSCEISDFSGTAWTTTFEDKAAPLLGVTGDQLAKLKAEDGSLYDAVFEKIRFREYVIRVRVKYDMYNDQQQMRMNIVDIKPVPYDKCKKMLTETIQKCENLKL
uniref:Replication protein A subunit n=1 Tax=Ditylenchus dipsaci TaxID=166011 RepID=A0A915CMF3_9BILA